MYLIYKAVGPSGLVYVGLTSQTLAVRMAGHKHDALARTRNIPFHNAIKKYGIESFVWVALTHNIETREEAERLERHYIKFYRSINRQFGYNRTAGGDGLDPEDYETIEKIRQSVIKHYQSSDFSRKDHSHARGGFPLRVMRKGELIGVFDTQLDACESLGLHPSKVCNCLKGLRKTHKGYTFERAV